MAQAARKGRIAIGSMSNETSHFLTTTSDLSHWQNNYVLHGADLFQLEGTDSPVVRRLWGFSIGGRSALGGRSGGLRARVRGPSPGGEQSGSRDGLWFGLRRFLEAT